MERDGWPDLPWLHAITPIRSYSTIFQHLLYLLRTHNGLLDFSKVKAHDDCDGNNRADRLANTGHLSGRTFDLSLLHTPSNWVNTSPVLNNSSISALSASAVHHVISPPILSNKVTVPLWRWRLFIKTRYQVDIEPARYIPCIWRLHIWATLKEAIWKHLLGSLPLGRHCHAISDLGRICRCGATMSLDHLWSSCPAYDIKCLRDATNSRMTSLTPKFYVKYTDLDGSSMQWMTLLTLQRLDRALMEQKHQSSLKDMLPL